MNTQQLKELAKLADSEVTWILLPKDLANDGWCTEVVNYISVVSPSTITALVDRIEAAERERDELREDVKSYSEHLHYHIDRQCKAEAELARRDAAAGDPLAFTHESEISNMHATGLYIRGFPADRRLNAEEGYTVALYTAAQPAVLPPDITFESKGFISLTSEDFAYNRALEDARKLGAQPQKVVELPETYWTFDDDKHPVLDADEVIAALDAAGVKWEVKK